MIALLIVAAGLSYGGVAFAGDPRFALDAMTVSGAQRVSQQSIIAAAALPRGSNIWLIDTREAAQRIEAMPWVASAGISRAWPNRLTITVVERSPVVRLASLAAQPPNTYALVGADGHVLEVGQTSGADSLLPVLYVEPFPAVEIQPGASLAASAVGDALSVQRSLNALGIQMTEMRVAPITGISVVTTARLHVMFGAPDDLERKVALYDAIAKRIAHPDAVAYIDLRSPSAPTVQYRR